MSRFLFDASGPTVVVSLTEAGAAWSFVQNRDDIQLVELKHPLSAAHLTVNMQSCEQDIRASSKVRGVSRTLWVLSSFWLNTWVQSLPTGVESMSELESLAKARATQLFGPAADGQPWSVSADWKSHGPFLCHAAPASVVSVLRSDAMQSPLTLALHAASCLPELKTMHGVAWIAFTVPGEIHVVAFQGGYPITLSSRRGHPNQTAREALAQAVTLWRREQVRTSRCTEHLFWLDGSFREFLPDGECPPEVTCLKAPWLQHAKYTADLTPAGRCLSWVLDMQRASQ